MFNEGTIYGTSKATKDGKNRLIMPSYTGAAKEDQLVIVRYNNFFKIMRKDVLDKQIKVIEDEIIELIKRGSISQVDALQKYKDSIMMDVVKTARVDGQGRIALTGVYDEDTKFTLVGAKDGVYVMNDEAYESYREEVRSVSESVKKVMG